jgi:ABC-type branched-subunit amino acid transport system permease subunit
MRVHHNGFVEPASFNFNLLVVILTATIVGGMATVAGPWSVRSWCSACSRLSARSKTSATSSTRS